MYGKASVVFMVLCILFAGPDKTRATRPKDRSATTQGKKDHRPTAAEMKAMRAERYQVFRLKKRVQSEFLCRECKGKGKLKTVQRTRNRAGGWAHGEDGWRVCPACGGTKICPSFGFHKTLAEYQQRKMHFNAAFPWEAPISTGLEPWLFKNLKTVGALQILNSDAAERLKQGGKVGDAYLMGVETFNLTRMEGQVVVQARIGYGDDFDEHLNLMILLKEPPEGLESGSRLLVLAYREGDVQYENLFEEKRTAIMLSADLVDLIGGKPSWW